MNTVQFHGAMHPKRAIRFKPHYTQSRQIFATQPIVRRRFVFALIMVSVYAAVWLSCF